MSACKKRQEDFRDLSIFKPEAKGEILKIQGYKRAESHPQAKGAVFHATQTESKMQGQSMELLVGLQISGGRGLEIWELFR